MKKLNLSILFFTLLFVVGSTVDVIAQKRKKLTAQFHGVVQLHSEPAGAQVYLDGKLVCPRTPGYANIDKDITLYYTKKKEDELNRQAAIEANTLKFEFVKDGYLTGVEKLPPVINFQRLPPMGIPFMACGYPEVLSHNLVEDPNVYLNDTSMRAGEAKKPVSRDNPGSTALERTIIRWYFESEPQGARIFWRVISSCPDQVKNTNELWLGNTPFEETRSFNIQGLTYQNANDVQIEIKVRRSGYLDQTKRFNVRQAIDQQEISSFFDMIKIEE